VALITLLPVIGKTGVWFGWWPVLLRLICATLSPLITIFIRRDNEKFGTPISALWEILSVISAIVMVIACLIAGRLGVIFLTIGASPTRWLMLIYMGAWAWGLNNSVWTKTYQRIGTALTTTLYCASRAWTIILPVLVLSEPFDPAFAIGALLILAGVIVVKKGEKVAS
jgi:drug/metabolite transporter (DMT)-like permease